MLRLLGLVSVAIAKGSMMASMVSLFIGLSVGAIGLDPLYAMPRLTFGWHVLDNGVSFVVVLIGMFAIGEVLGCVISAISGLVQSSARLLPMGLKSRYPNAAMSLVLVWKQDSLPPKLLKTLLRVRQPYRC